MFGLPTDTRFPGLRGGAERRTSDRFPIEREIRYRVINRRQGSENGGGTTVNMSSSGVLFSSELPLLPGKRVEMAISWPAQLDNRCALKLMARGRIVRCDQGRVAVEIQQYEFRTMGGQGLAL
jgi:hypothetical protein